MKCCICFYISIDVSTALQPFNFQLTKHRMLLMRWQFGMRLIISSYMRHNVLIIIVSTISAQLLELPLILNNQIQQIYRMNVLSLLSINCYISIGALTEA